MRPRLPVVHDLVSHDSLQRWTTDAAIEPILNGGIGRSHGSKPWAQQHSGCIEVGDREFPAVNVRSVCKPAPQKLQRSVQSGCVNACFGPIGGVMGAFKLSHRPGQPLVRVGVRIAACWPELRRVVLRQVQVDGQRFNQCIVAIHEHRNLTVWIDLQVRVAPCFAFSESDLPKLVVHPSFFKHPEAAKGPRLFRPVQCEQGNTQAQMKTASQYTGWDGSR